MHVVASFSTHIKWYQQHSVFDDVDCMVHIFYVHAACDCHGQSRLTVWSI